MRGRIFTAYHFMPKPGEARDDDLYVPVLMTDDSVLAPHDDRRFCGYESLKWYIWREWAQRYMWVGFGQYRRQLDFGERTNEEIDELAARHDIITNPPVPGVDLNMREQYKSCHIPEHWAAFEKVMGPGWDFTGHLIPHGGLGTMRTKLFKNYMTQWEQVFQELAKIIKTPDHRYQRRVYGFLAERFFALYFYRLLNEHPETKVLFLPSIKGAQQHYT